VRKRRTEYSAVWAYTPAMGVSTGTVITHQSNLYAKLGVHSRAGLLAALQFRQIGARAIVEPPSG
jgi:hypothetical protein